MVVAAYNASGKNGKPKARQGTVLCGFVLQTGPKCFTLASWSTGTKCLSRSRLPTDGSLLHDSHGEPLLESLGEVVAECGVEKGAVVVMSGHHACDGPSR